MKRSAISVAIRSALGFTAVALMLPTSQVLAQAEQSASDQPMASEPLEEVYVTGSRISRPNLTQATPVTEVSADDLANFGTLDLGGALAELPTVGATNTLQGNADSNADAGLSLADLRRLGADRTLTLIDGRRHVGSSNGSVAVDLGTIPAGLIEKVEIVTGGASAIYGSDAVSGVVNIITKDDFEGFQINFTGDQSLEGVGSGSQGVNLLAGLNTGDGKGNFTFYLAQEQINEVMVTDLRHTDNWGTIVNPEDTGEDDGIPDRIAVPRVYSELIDENGVINPFGGPGGTWVFDNAGNPVLQTQRDQTNSFAFGNFPNGCEFCFELDDYRNVMPDVRRNIVNTTFNYDLADSLSFFSEFKYVTSEIDQVFQPDFFFGNKVINVADNPFLDEGLRQTLLDAGQSQVLFAKFLADVPRNADNDRELFRYVGGFEGEFLAGATPVNFETSFNYGRTTNTLRTTSTLIEGNFDAALDAVIDPATGEAACRSQVPSAQGPDYTDPATTNADSCAPYNPFGRSGSAESLAFVSTATSDKSIVEQKVYSGYMSFDTAEFLNLPAGAIGIAAGFEYREESSEQQVDALRKQNLLSSAATPDSFGEFDVSEGFLEVNVPLLEDMPGVHSMSLDGAVRYADYSHAGSANTWKAGLMYSPVEDITLRATQALAIRAPNITEAFAPQQPGFANINDPCDADNINDDPDRAANCAALGIPAGFQANDNVSIDTFSGGNPDLTPEESDSFTAGIVWQPSFVEGLSLTLDYYEIDITDAIISVTAQSILDNCVDASGGPDANFCAQIDRNGVNDVELVRSGFVNASALETSGYDLTVSYDTPLSLGSIDGNLRTAVIANYLDELNVFEFQNRPDEVNFEAGEIGDPEWQFRWTADYSFNDTRIGYAMRAVDEQARFDVSPTGDSPEDTSPAFVDTQIYHDINLSQRLTDNIVINGGVRNLLDDELPGYIDGYDGDESIFDAVGRRVFLGINISL